ncbi:MAG: hypothetical protein IPL79_19255 [Myxococcales bacterium]|nr:hypothetical protein [Myxococcales bacterium]
MRTRFPFSIFTGSRYRIREGRVHGGAAANEFSSSLTPAPARGVGGGPTWWQRDAAKNWRFETMVLPYSLRLEGNPSLICDPRFTQFSNGCERNADGAKVNWLLDSVILDYLQENQTLRSPLNQVVKRLAPRHNFRNKDQLTMTAAHARTSSLRPLALAMVVAMAVGACVSAVREPRMAVVGVEGSSAPMEPITLFLEVANPTSVPLILSKLSYRIESENAVLEAAPDRGEPDTFFSQLMSVTSTRTILPGASIFIEVPAIVPASSGTRYTLHSTLEGTQNNQHRKFKMQSAIADLSGRR